MVPGKVEAMTLEGLEKKVLAKPGAEERVSAIVEEMMALVALNKGHCPLCAIDENPHEISPPPRWARKRRCAYREHGLARKRIWDWLEENDE